MTNPAGSDLTSYLLDGWDGVLFGASSGGISNLQNLNQAAVMAAKQALIEGNEVLSFVLGLIFDGLRNGIPLALAIIEGIIVKLFGLIPGFTTIEEALNAIGEVPFIADIVQAITGTVGGTLHDIEIWAASLGSDVSGAAAKLAALISGVGGTVIGDVSGAINAANEDIAELIDGVGGLVIDDVVGKIILIQQIIDGIANALGHPGTGHSIAQLITYVANIPGDVISGVTRDWVPALALVGATTPDQLVNALRGLVAAAQRDVDGTMAVIGTGVANFVDNANGTWSFVVGQGEADVAGLVQGADGAVYTAGQIAQQAVAAAAAAGVGLGQAISSGQQMVDHGIAAITGGAAQVGQEAHEFAGALTAGYTSWYNAWTSGAVSTASSPDITEAAYAAAAAAAYQAQQTAGITSLIPHFYGGSGTSGLPLTTVPFSGTLPASFTSAASIAANSAVYNVATASTDQETVSAFWNTSLASIWPLWSAATGEVGDPWARYLFLRSKSDLTTYLYVKIWRAFNGAVFEDHIEIGCVVSGIQTVLGTDVLTVADAVYPSVSNGPQAWSLEATGNAIEVTGPGGYSFSAIDGTPSGSPVVSQVGSLYRSAGIGSDEPNWLTKITDWNFYDSGPTAGPDRADVATSESTSSTTFANLATNHQAVVNIGPSGLAWVSFSCDTGNDGWYSDMALELSGANTRAASSSPAARYQNPATGVTSNTIGLAYLETGLLAGPTNFTAKHRANPSGGNTATFANRRISVTPL